MGPAKFAIGSDLTEGACNRLANFFSSVGDKSRISPCPSWAGPHQRAAECTGTRVHFWGGMSQQGVLSVCSHAHDVSVSEMQPQCLCLFQIAGNELPLVHAESSSRRTTASVNEAAMAGSMIGNMIRNGEIRINAPPRWRKATTCCRVFLFPPS